MIGDLKFHHTSQNSCNWRSKEILCAKKQDNVQLSIKAIYSGDPLSWYSWKWLYSRRVHKRQLVHSFNENLRKKVQWNVSFRRSNFASPTQIFTWNAHTDPPEFFFTMILHSENEKHIQCILQHKWDMGTTWYNPQIQ